MSKHKERLDKMLVKLGFFDTRERAKKAIMAGLVRVDGRAHIKAGDQVSVMLEKHQVTVKGDAIPFVSRGGLKLARGLRVFDFPVAGKTFLDIGASTGGFTDCLLQNGAFRVIAADVGYGQFDWKLRNDSRVICLERTNFRYAGPDTLPGLDTPADGSVMDVSFISMLKMMPAIYRCVKPGALGIWLIKPQFEVGKEKVGKHGVVRDPAVHREAIAQTAAGIEAAGFSVAGLDYSPIRGPRGNIEFLCLTRKEASAAEVAHDEAVSGAAAIEALVTRAHRHYQNGESEETK
ncbi:TlyA family RNA methyltransferase [Pseudoramibacter alactolyticus]